MKKEEGKIVVAHDDIRHLIDIIHYDDHPSRTESVEFIALRKAFHDAGAKCVVDNGYCEGGIEIHHGEIEYSASTEVDWVRIMQDLGFDHVDDVKQMVPICKKHHTGTGTGKHNMSDPAWKLQKYMTQKNLALFEAAVAHLKSEKHPNHEDRMHPDHHIVNRKAEAILKTLAASQIKEMKEK